MSSVGIRILVLQQAQGKKTPEPSPTLSAITACMAPCLCNRLREYLALEATGSNCQPDLLKSVDEDRK